MAWFRKVPAVFYMLCLSLALLNYCTFLQTILRTYTIRRHIFRTPRRSLHCGRGGEERSGTHYAEKRWGREMASKRRKRSGGNEQENSFVGKMGEEGSLAPPKEGEEK